MERISQSTYVVLKVLSLHGCLGPRSILLGMWLGPAIIWFKVWSKATAWHVMHISLICLVYGH